MKDFFKACKLYFKTVFSPGLAVVGIFMMLVCVFFMLAVGLAYEDKNSVSMMAFGPLSMFHVFVLMFFQKYEKVTQNKFFLSMKNAKQFYTVIPMTVIGSMFLIFDFICFVLALCLFDGEYAGDLLIVFSASTILGTVTQTAEDMPKLRFVNVISAFFMLLFNPAAILCVLGYEKGLGLPLATDILISLGIYIVGGALIVGIMTLWWHKSGRVLKFKKEKKKMLY